jgi:Right handed beta helix region
MRLRSTLGLALAAASTAGCGSPVAPSSSLTPTSATSQALVNRGILIKNQHHRTYKRLRVVTAAGDCVTVAGSSDITIEESEVGPCGGNGVIVGASSNIRIYDSYVHPETRSRSCCDRHDGILLENSSDVTIQGNVIAYGESNVEAPQEVAGLVVIGNFLLNPRGPYPRGQNVQAWNSRDVRVQGNYTLSSQDTARYKYPDDQQDSINFGEGMDFTAVRNYVTGGHSPSGCGLIADENADRVRFIGNRVVDSGECGIGIASGTDQLVERNEIINRNPVRGGGNTALYVWNQYAGISCGPVTVSDIVATELRPNGVQSGFWNGGGCDPVRLRRNVWNEAARERLTPVRKKLPAPSIPPQPKHCAIESPYSNQTEWPACGLP